MADHQALKDQLYQRFDRYVRIHTTSDKQSTTVPSTARQLQLSRLLAEELTTLGVGDVHLAETGYVYASLPPSPGCENAPPIGLIAHVDTSPDVSGEGVVPQRHSPYAGGSITISQEPPLQLSPESSPELADHHGHEIVTASGTTLLGADNKAGIAIIMTLAERLLHDSAPHGPVRIAFTVDEEIGRGMDHFDLSRFAATYAYTIDGGIQGQVEMECFNADGLEISIKGRSIHPGTAKNQMANATSIAAEIVAAWPDYATPEHTEKREGFVLFDTINGTVEHATIRGIVRDHDLAKLHAHEQILTSLVDAARIKHPRATIDLTFTEQYRNMRQIIDQHPIVIEALREAFARCKLPMQIHPIRGGTDGSRLSFMGIPTPNIFTGGANYHARDEWISLDAMASSVSLLQHLLTVFAETR